MAHPLSPDALQGFQWALSRFQSGQWEEAIPLCVQLLQTDPSCRDPLALLAMIALEASQRDVVTDALNQAGLASSELAYYHYTLGLLEFEKGSLEAAIQSFECALQLNPSMEEAYFNKGLALKSCNENDAAIQDFKQILKLNPSHLEAALNLGNLFRQVGRFEEAEAYYQQALQINPNTAFVHYNLGLLYRDQQEREKAIQCFQRAVHLDPALDAAFDCLTFDLMQSQRFEEALTCFDAIIQSQPDRVAPRVDRAMLLLLRGQFPQGWEAYEWRRQQGDFLNQKFSFPQWQGEPLKADQTLLVVAEQGFGDTFQFLRYLPLLKEQGGQIFFACSPFIVRLLQTYPGIDTLIPVDNVSVLYQGYDYYHYLLSSPRILGTNLSNIPPLADMTGIQDAEIVQQWEKRIPEDDKFKIGIVWASNAEHTTSVSRSCPLSLFSGLDTGDSTAWYSLQKSPTALSDMQTAALPFPVDNLEPELRDFADTAAAITRMDLVITIDTSVAHLAGILGKPVWILLSYVPDWRWGLQGETTPWYPTARLFRQSMENDWALVFENVKKALKEVE